MVSRRFLGIDARAVVGHGDQQACRRCDGPRGGWCLRPVCPRGAVLPAFRSRDPRRCAADGRRGVSSRSRMSRSTWVLFPDDFQPDFLAERPGQIRAPCAETGGRLHRTAACGTAILPGTVGGRDWRNGGRTFPNPPGGRTKIGGIRSLSMAGFIRSSTRSDKA